MTSQDIRRQLWIDTLSVTGLRINNNIDNNYKYIKQIMSNRALVMKVGYFYEGFNWLHGCLEGFKKKGKSTFHAMSTVQQ